MVVVEVVMMHLMNLLNHLVSFVVTTYSLDIFLLLLSHMYMLYNVLQNVGPDDIQLPDASLLSAPAVASSNARDVAMFSNRANGNNGGGDGGMDDAPEIDRDQMEDGREADDKVTPLPTRDAPKMTSTHSGSSSSTSTMARSSAPIVVGGGGAPSTIESKSRDSGVARHAAVVSVEVNELDEKAAYITNTLLRMLVKVRFLIHTIQYNTLNVDVN
jgi:hypothetical protein